MTITDRLRAWWHRFRGGDGNAATAEAVESLTAPAESPQPAGEWVPAWDSDGIPVAPLWRPTKENHR